MESDENDYGRFHKGSPDIMEKYDAQYQLEEALREVERLQRNAQGTIDRIVDEGSESPSDPVTCLCVLAVGLKMERDKYIEAIRKHRDQWLGGDNKCWKDNEELYMLLPEGYTPPERDTTVELHNCERYIQSCHDPRVKYTSPQVRIEELEKLVEELREQVRMLNQLIDTSAYSQMRIGPSNED